MSRFESKSDASWLTSLLLIRPQWNSEDSKEQLERSEKDAFLEWRRDLAQLQEGTGFVLTPFERNIEVWRQLWRVIERSDLLVQIVDARNPLRFRCPDLETYVTEMGTEPSTSASQTVLPPKRQRNNLLLINKADLLDEGQRWVHCNCIMCDEVF